MLKSGKPSLYKKLNARTFFTISPRGYEHVFTKNEWVMMAWKDFWTLNMNKYLINHRRLTESPTRCSLFGNMLNTALETPDSLHVLVRNHLDYYPDISPIPKGISWRSPSLLIINFTPKIYNKIYQERLQNVLKHTQDLYQASQALYWLHLALVLSIIHLLIIYLVHLFYLFLYHAMDALLWNCHCQVVVHL